MFVTITNTPRDYAWGSRGAISALLGAGETSALEAELWLGAHPGSPSTIVEPAQVDGARDLEEWIHADPVTALGVDGGTRLPFLLKVLAAASPLSLQAHPTPDQAVRGFERENAAGVPLDAAHRNYKDSSAKPELIVAVSDRFEALCGFRPTRESLGELEQLIAKDPDSHAAGAIALRSLAARLAEGDSALSSVVQWLLVGGGDVAALVEHVSALASGAPGEHPVVDLLAAAYPGDPGIVIAMLLHHVGLSRGEALYLPAGNIHAYLSGVGIELMAASDNVLRGGLTPKHVDIPELLDVLDFSTVPAPYLAAQRLTEGLEVFRPDVPDFRLAHVTADAEVGIDGPAIVLVTAGEFTIDGALSRRTVARGDSVFVTPDETALTFSGAGEAFVATVGRATAAA